MKKFTLLMSATIVALSFGAASTAQAREVTEIVGYVKTTETIVPVRDNEFAEMDKNQDGVVTFKEFQDGVILEHEYEIFKLNDINNDGVLSLDEYRKFSKFPPRKNRNFFN